MGAWSWNTSACLLFLFSLLFSSAHFALVVSSPSFGYLTPSSNSQEVVEVVATPISICGFAPRPWSSAWCRGGASGASRRVWYPELGLGGRGWSWFLPALFRGAGRRREDAPPPFQIQPLGGTRRQSPAPGGPIYGPGHVWLSLSPPVRNVFQVQVCDFSWKHGDAQIFHLWGVCVFCFLSFLAASAMIKSKSCLCDRTPNMVRHLREGRERVG